MVCDVGERCSFLLLAVVCVLSLMFRCLINVLASVPDPGALNYSMLHNALSFIQQFMFQIRFPYHEHQFTSEKQRGTVSSNSRSQNSTTVDFRNFTVCFWAETPAH